jgi:hypothetical protein
MWWVTWRQHRAELLGALLLLAAVAVPLLVTGVAMHEEYRTSGAAACVADPAVRPGCGQLVAQFRDRHLEWATRLMAGAFLPAVAGVFIGAPLLAREFEHGTWRLAFTQGVTRTRWLAGRLALVGACVAAVTAAFAALFTWWRGPLDEIGGRMRSVSFLIAVPSLTSAALFAFAVGVLAGAVLRRTVPAMVAALAVFLLVRIPMEEYARPHYVTPLTRITDPVTGPAPDWRPATGWTIETGWIDASGHRLSEGEEGAILEEIYRGDGRMFSGPAIERYLADHGLRHYTEYVPASRYWTLQAIESMWFLGAAAVLLAATVWIVRRRTT